MKCVDIYVLILTDSNVTVDNDSVLFYEKFLEGKFEFGRREEGGGGVQTRKAR